MTTLKRLGLSAFAGFTLFLTPIPALPCSLAPQIFTIPAENDFNVPLNGKIQFASFPNTYFPKLFKAGKEVPAKMVSDVREAIYLNVTGNYTTTFNTLETDKPLEPETLYTLVLDPEEEDGNVHFVSGKQMDESPPEIQSARIVKIHSREGMGGSMCDYGGIANEVSLEIKTLDPGNSEEFIFYKVFLVKEGETLDFQKSYLHLGYGLSDFEKSNGNSYIYGFHFPEDKKQDYHLYMIAKDIHGFESAAWVASFTSVPKGGADITAPVDFSPFQVYDIVLQDPNVSTDVGAAGSASSSCMNLGATSRNGFLFTLALPLLLIFLVRRYRQCGYQKVPGTYWSNRV